ncbi:GntR family transcriptional regulator [Streptomyces sp. NPDC002143]
MVVELRRMISSGELLPGQQIRQESMAEQLGVSRLPVREGLRQLAADGLVSHVHNVGYTVTRLNQSEFDEIYLMRKLLETEVIGRLPMPPTPEQLQRVIDLNDKVVAASDRLDLVEMRLQNHEFHFEMFRLSGLKMVIDEIERLWNWAAPYHSVYLFSPDSRRAVLEEHAAMVEALRAGDNARLVQLMDQHRHGSETQLGLMLGGGMIARPMPS